MVPRLDAAGDPELRRALKLARSRSEPLSADDAAAALGVHRNVARARLDRLASAGFLHVFFARRGDRRGPGAGRPAKLYAVAPETELLEFPERHLDDLGKLLIDQLDESSLRNAGIEYGRLLASRMRLRRASGVAHGLAGLCRRLGENGFQVTVVEATPMEVTLACPTCPLRPIVRVAPDGATLDRGMWAGLVERSLGNVAAADVTCSTEGCSDDHATCRIVIRLPSVTPQTVAERLGTKSCRKGSSPPSSTSYRRGMRSRVPGAARRSGRTAACGLGAGRNGGCARAGLAAARRVGSRADDVRGAGGRRSRRCSTSTTTATVSGRSAIGRLLRRATATGASTR